MSTISSSINRRQFIIGATVAAGAAKAVAKPVPKAATDLGKAVGELPPGRYDAHTHVYLASRPNGEVRPDALWKVFSEGRLTGGCVFSEDPNRFYWKTRTPETEHNAERAIDNVIKWCSKSPTLYPFYWIDPWDPRALEYVDLAVSKGIYGFKVISSRGYPCDDTTMKVYRRIAEANKPLTFHSGILWDGQATSEFFRPVFFEKLMNVPHLRFCLAHVSWPWIDECIATYGKLYAAAHWGYRSDPIGEMFIDTTRGTPEIYRREALTKLYTVGYDFNEHLMFGTDMFFNGATAEQPIGHMSRDDAIFDELKLDEAKRDSYYRKALQRFLFGGT